MQMRAEDEAGIGPIKDSYAFDVKDERQLMRHGTEVFNGEVLGVTETDYKVGNTLWRVRVMNTIRGYSSGEALVRQRGDQQPLLVAGRRQLLVTTRVGGASENTLIAGPAASVPVKSSVHERQLVQEYREAMR